MRVTKDKRDTLKKLAKGRYLYTAWSGKEYIVYRDDKARGVYKWTYGDAKDYFLSRFYAIRYIDRELGE